MEERTDPSYKKAWNKKSYLKAQSLCGGLHYSLLQNEAINIYIVPLKLVDFIIYPLSSTCVVFIPEATNPNVVLTLWGTSKPNLT